MAACRTQPGTATPESRRFPPLPEIILPPTATFVPTLSRKPTATLTATPTATLIIHVVQKGEILGQIALDYSVPLEAIILANGLENAHLLSLGQKLVIPNEAMIAEMARGGLLEINLFTPTPAAPTPTLRPGSIAWQDALQHIGIRVPVEGRIARTRKTGGTVYLFFHDPPEGYLGIKIPPERTSGLGQPEVDYLDHWVLVVGTVERNDEGLLITVDDRAQISILQ